MAPNKLREIIVARINAGESVTTISKDLNISRNAVYKAKKAYEEHGTTDYLPRSGRPTKEGKEDLMEAVSSQNVTPSIFA